MVVCKYFLQGTCKFGINCYNEHQNPSNNTNFSSTSILRQTNFGNTQPTNTAKPANSVDVNTLVKSVVTDMTVAEKGGQWLFSCYAPYKEKPAFPGFEDTSPEEIRLSYYEAQKNGNIAQYTQHLQGLLQSAILRIRALQNPTQELVNILLTIYNSPPSSSSGTFGTPTVSNTGSSNIFANQANTPANPNTGTVFQTQQTSANIFGGGNPQAQTSTNIFSNVSNNTVNQPQGNIFPNQGNPNIFASNQQPTTSVFGAAPTQGNQSVFAVGNSTSPFNANKTGQNIFVPQPQQSIFATQNSQTPPPPSQNIFAPSVPTSNIFSNNASIFSNSPNPQPASTGTHNYSSSIFSGPNKVSEPIDENIYSKEDELPEDVKKYYQNDVFDIMNIPSLPPTYDMCFDA